MKRLAYIGAEEQRSTHVLTNRSLAIDLAATEQDRLPPSVSVILLAHNAEVTIGPAIESIQIQSLSHWELIVVDVSSNDRTQAVIERWVAGDRRIRMLNPATTSMVAARACGLALAEGRYIYCLDASYRSGPDALQRLTDALDADPDAVLAYGTSPGHHPLHAPAQPFASGAGALGVLAGLVQRDFFNTGTLAFRRAALDDGTITDVLPLDDATLCWLLVANGALVWLDGVPLSDEYPRDLPDLQPHSSVNSVGVSPSAAPPSKLAYLIVAHHQPQHLARLVRALAHDESYVFIHIDQKTALAPFTDLLPPSNNIMFLPERVPVAWGTLSVVQAMLTLLETAVDSGHNFSYYTVLSGSDYPIKDAQTIAMRLRTSDRQFLRIDRKLMGEPPNDHFWFLKDLPDGRYFGNLTPYHGSMYWSLTAACVRFILDFLHANPGYLPLHQHIFAPDEIFFHTLVKHSPFASAITHDVERAPCADHLHHGNHYIDWAGRRPRHNLTLDERDFDDLLASDALFARKFDETHSSQLLDLIDEHMHGRHPAPESV